MGHFAVAIGSCRTSRLGWGMAGHENSARPLRTDGAINHLASVRRLKLDALVTTLVAVRMILVIHCDLGNFGLGESRVQRGGEEPCGSDSTAEQRPPGKSCRCVLRFA